MAKQPITGLIKEKFGTVKHYAKVNGLHYELLRQVIAGHKVSKACVAQLKKDGFMQ